MKVRLAAVATFAVLAGLAGPAWAGDPFGFDACIVPPPDVAECFAGDFFLQGEVKWLTRISCAVTKISDWQLATEQCLEANIERRHRLIMFPQALKQDMVELTRLIHAAKTLQASVEDLACGWRYSARSKLLRDLYLKPLKLCKPGIELILGDSSPHFDAEYQELLHSTSALTHNLVEERTVGSVDPGEKAMGPEYTWMRIANEELQNTTSRIRTPGVALRYAGQLWADRLQVQDNTLTLSAQALSVGQQRREYERLKKKWDRALHVYIGAQIIAAGEDQVLPLGDGITAAVLSGRER